ncbi:UMP1-domain-containing protein [Sodiomyces alkalinus F11]|uniref:UMP1-domain-containing protein n=1 Tax=Sodiomyces alkalinus (strain CBS 110278 / VKM F-3762 / F11) TaxID=1314773 RepID=A0A3N2Q538_SODAK|nr:UMP1-domain-containing protein [Sodiomyces alkalinus F11]ROT41883.1 UMP1-domain-containing protein [Sodiomyces alkalinus F11]
MRIVPGSANPATFTAGNAAPSVPGLHDTLRTGLGPSPLSSSLHHSSSSSTNNTNSASATTPSAELTSAHPLEARLKNWEATQEALRMETLRRTYGAAEPIRRQMELKITRNGVWRPAALGGGSHAMSHHEEILRGRDDSITWEDVFTGDEAGCAGAGNAALTGMHEEMERKLRM